MLAASDISDVPASDVKNILIVIGFLVTMGMNGVALLMGRRTQVSGSVKTSAQKEPADKSEVEDELQALLAKIEEVKTALNKAVRDITTAGQQRADTITRKIDEEVRAIRTEIDNRMALVHEKVNSVIVTAAVCESDIEHLKARDYQHDQAIATLQERTHSPRKAG